MKILIISSFVLPHLGGVEQYVETSARVLRRRGWDVRVLACRLPDGQARADVALPTRYLPLTQWPLPSGGWRTMWREIRDADVVVANGTRQLLPVLSAFAARAAGKPTVMVLHGGAELAGDSLLYHRVLGALFDRTFARAALRLSLPAAPSRSGVVGARRTYGIDARFVPFPLRELPPAGPPPPLAADAPLRIVWAGRLFAEKDPLAAVAAVERLIEARAATLQVYGEGPLLPELERLARSRPWLELHPSLPWDDIQTVTAGAHAFLSTSVRDAAQLGVLEALCRGIPVVATAVGDAPHYYLERDTRRFCVPARDPEAAGSAMLALACSPDTLRGAFAANGRALLQRHGEAAQDALVALIADAAQRANEQRA
jgi:glycosyltransferase involved in cell wall biosynthesis